MNESDDPGREEGLDDPPDTGEELATSASIHKDAWSQTLEDMEAMATDLEDEGWDVVTVTAVDTAPEPPEDGPSDRWGIVHVVPDNQAEAFAAAVDEGEFPRYDVYRAVAEGRVFHVTELLDPETETAILIAGNFRRSRAEGVVRTAREEGELYTHAQTLSGDRIGAFRHDGYEKFFPEADRLVDVAEARKAADDGDDAE